VGTAQPRRSAAAGGAAAADRAEQLAGLLAEPLHLSDVWLVAACQHPGLELYVNWLTHAKNAIRMDAEIGTKAVEHLLGVFTAARMRLRYPGTRCFDCGSYRIVGGTCEHCGWEDPQYEPSDLTPVNAFAWSSHKVIAGMKKCLSPRRIGLV
jgi:hypothetical protein